MKKTTAFCGLRCDKCPTFIATRDNDDQARAKTAAMYEKAFGWKLKPSDINCDGCHAESGRIIAYCRECDIRKCGREKGYENCGQCPESPCEKIERFHAFAPASKAAFDKMMDRNR